MLTGLFISDSRSEDKYSSFQFGIFADFGHSYAVEAGLRRGRPLPLFKIRHDDAGQHCGGGGFSSDAQQAG
jgi:hypothetical protein